MNAFDWQDFIPLAERLVSDVAGEAAQRTAISRAYYAAYHVAAALVRRQGLLRTRHSHRSVWDALANGTEPEIAAIGQSGHQLRQLRVHADYRAAFPGDVAERSMAAVAAARSLIDAMRRLELS